jgi:hypothetical protein
MSEISRRNVIEGSLAASLGLLAGKVSASEADEQTRNFKTNGANSMTLDEFRALNDPGSVPKLMGQMKCDTLSMCHKRLRDDQGIWIPELVPIFNEIDALTHPGSS